MILVENLEELIFQYLENPARSGTIDPKINMQEFASHIAKHLAQRGVELGWSDGSRFSVRGTMDRPPESTRHRLPLVLQERDGHIRIYCDGRDCYWSWQFDIDASPQINGEEITNAVRHARRRHVHI
jgi:hypothetical protein